MGFKIELLGLCGAGKTTFLTAINAKLVSDIDLSLAYPIVPPVSHTVLKLMKILCVGFFTEPIKFGCFILNKSNRWLVKKVAFRSAGINFRTNENFVLIDSGILQPFLSFEIEERLSESKIPIGAILEGCVLPKLVIVFIVPPKIAMKRYEQRGLSGKGKLIRENSRRHFDTAEKLRENLVEYCIKKNIQIIEVHSSQQFSDKYLNSKVKEIQTKLSILEGKDAETI